jgi:GNAT superfamily N-acetyltransferase
VRRHLSRLAGRWRGFPADARRALRSGDLVELPHLLANRSAHLLFPRDRMLIVAQALDSVREVPPPLGVTITFAAAGDWDLVSEVASARDVELFRERHAAGRTCLLACRDGRPIGYTWIAERIARDVTVCPIPLPSNAAYLYDLYVSPGERSSAVGPALVSARLQLARARGFAEGWRMISVGNRASFRTVEKTAGPGTRVVGEMYYVKVLDRMYPRFTPRSDVESGSP